MTSRDLPRGAERPKGLKWMEWQDWNESIAVTTEFRERDVMVDDA